MSQTASPALAASPIGAASLMVLAGIAFAGVNVATQALTYQMGFPAASAAFWQYFIALVFSLPIVFNLGLKALATRHPFLHVLRVGLSAAGVQAFALSFAQGVPVWQVIALVMTSPFFIVAGAAIFLHERVTLWRLGATLGGFTGAMIILQPWSASFTLAALLPVAAAAFWGGASLITKFLTREEKPESITLYLLALLTPINALFLVPMGLAMPDTDTIWLVIGLGAMTALANYFLTWAYSLADATYVQPFDDLKLPLNVVAGWIVFSQVPSPMFWPGAALIVAASYTIAWRERRGAPAVSKA